MKANRIWTRTAAGGTGLAADSVPGALDTDDDNLVTLSPPSAALVLPLRGLCVVYTGPTAQVFVKLHVWEETDGVFLQVSGSERLTANVATRIALPAALQADVARVWQTMHVLVALQVDGTATNGAHKFYAWGDLGP
jgi:hypothetical protein